MNTATTYPTGAHQLLAELIAADDIPPRLRLTAEVEHDGERWLIATNGRVLFAERSDAPPLNLRGEFNEEDRGPTPRPERFAAVAFPVPGEEIIGECSAERLREFAGVPDPQPPAVSCPECVGSGTVEHNCDCEYCDREGGEECPECEGKKVVTPLPPKRYGWIGAGVYDRNLLARVAHLLADPTPYTVHSAPQGEGYRLRVVGSNHFAVVMSCRYTGLADQRAAPHFEVTP